MSNSGQDSRSTVKEGYDAMAGKYLNWASSRSSPREKYVEDLIRRLSDREPSSSHNKPSKTLELGCGAGVPVMKMLLEQGFHAMGSDISSAQIKLAKDMCSGLGNSEFVEGDMTKLSFPISSFDAVISFFTIFHIPRIEQPGMLQRIHSWLIPGGLLLMNFGTRDLDDAKNEFHGEDMFFSGYDAEGNQSMVKQAGFELLSADVLDGSDGSDPKDPDFGIKFLWVVARKLG